MTDRIEDINKTVVYEMITAMEEDGRYVLTKQMVADYCEVDVRTIEKNPF